MTIETVDAVVIGMGPGGEDVAARLAKAGLAVVGVEGRLVGGECPYYGCVPTKMMIRAANTLADARRVDGLAGTAKVESDWEPVAARIRAEATDSWDDTVAVERFEKAGGRFVRGWGRITAPGEVTVTTSEGPRVFHAEKAIVLNPGTAPAVPPIPGLAGTPYWTNRDAVAVTEIPESLIVLGGGPVGVEFAQVFARFGSEVTVIESLQLLPRDEPKAGQLLAEVFATESITVRTAATSTGVEHDGTRFAVHLDNGETLYGKQLLVATGRTTDLAALGVGLTVRTGVSRIPWSARGWIHKAGNEGFIKLVEDTTRGVLVGATSVGPTGGEVLGALAVAVHAQVPTRQLREMIYAYPTFHRAIEAALNDLDDQ